MISSNLEDADSISDLKKLLLESRVIIQKEIRAWQKGRKLKADETGIKAFLKSIIDRITISNEKVEVYIKNPSSSIDKCQRC